MKDVLFSIAFSSLMSDADEAYLEATLDMRFNMHPKLAVTRQTPGLARLDARSGLCLVRGADPADWSFECRVYEMPPEDVARLWRIEATAAAHHLDPGVPPPRAPVSNDPGHRAEARPESP